MKSAIYNVRDSDNNPKTYLVVYDETMPCVLCGLPVESASVSATAICGWCDCGRPRANTEPYRKAIRVQMKRRGYNVTPQEAWSNKTQDFVFATREEANQKMRQLHGEGIEGWSHVITEGA